MDLSFARRRKAGVVSTTPDLSVLLSEISARQEASRTARIQARLGSPQIMRPVNPLIDIFAPVGAPTAATHRFSDQILNPVNSRKLT